LPGEVFLIDMGELRGDEFGINFLPIKFTNRYSFIAGLYTVRDGFYPFSEMRYICIAYIELL
jgi:hypothetical protein